MCLYPSHHESAHQQFFEVARRWFTTPIAASHGYTVCSAASDRDFEVLASFIVQLQGYYNQDFKLQLTPRILLPPSPKCSMPISNTTMSENDLLAVRRRQLECPLSHCPDYLVIMLAAPSQIHQILEGWNAQLEMVRSLGASETFLWSNGIPHFSPWQRFRNDYARSSTRATSVRIIWYIWRP